MNWYVPGIPLVRRTGCRMYVGKRLICTLQKLTLVGRDGTRTTFDYEHRSHTKEKTDGHKDRDLRP